MPLPNDPLFTQQWHLNNTTPGLLDLNIVDAGGVNSLWDDYTGVGINVFVIDNAFDYTHADLAGNYNTALDFDFENNDLDPFGLSTESHGTAVMGIIGAVGNNNIGVTGIAYESTLVGYQTNGFINDAWLQDIRDAIAAAPAGGADVVNISQGIANDANSEFGNGYNALRFTEIDASINTAVTTGRGGLGTTIVKSAGNSRSDNYDVNSDPWTNNTEQVVVAAVDQNGFVSSYSSYGAANLVSAFGTPGEVVTTDRTGSAGYNITDYTSTFNGTSAAAPEVAGVVALMLDANESLGWRDVQDILSYSARHVGSAVDNTTIAGSERTPWDWNAAETWNGGGMHFSNDYGYGLVDAHAAVRMAESWLAMDAAQTSANQASTFQDGLNVATVIPDGNLTGTSFNIAESESIMVERVTVTISFSTTFLADMEIYLTSPDGQEHLLIQDQAGGADFNGTYTFESQAFRGEMSDGNWTVRIVDDAGFDTLTVTDIDLRTYGRDASINDRFIFTNEFSDYAGVGGHTTAINDTNGGSDWINAAAVTANTTIDLNTGTGTIDGVAITTANIENVYTGDGNDTVTTQSGSTILNEIHLGRGNDTAVKLSDTHSAFPDIYDGGEGTDTFFWNRPLASVNSSWVIHLALGKMLFLGADRDTLLNFENVTVNNGANIVGNGGINVLSATGNFDNVIYGNGGNDVLLAGAGNDILLGGSGGDTLNGGTGTDRAQYHDSAGGLTADLQFAAVNTGIAAGDTYVSIEHLFGSGFNDSLRGDAGANTIWGWNGNDVIYGRNGNDVLLGGAGNDILIGGAGGDILNGGTGTDRAQYHDSAGGLTADLQFAAVNTGIAAGDTYVSIEHLFGSGFNDSLRGDAGANTIWGWNGNDVIYGRNGNDVLLGGAGNDILIGGASGDILNGGTGTDRAQYHDSAGGLTADLQFAAVNTGIAAGDTYVSIEHLFGSGFNDSLRGDAGANTIWGWNGNDVIYGRNGNDVLLGGAGNDILLGGSGGDTLNGGTGTDRAQYHDSAGGLTADLQFAAVNTGIAAGDTYVSIEHLFGSGFNDNLRGDAGANTIWGWNGNDVINGRGGNDVLLGGAGTDSFVFDDNAGADTIVDWSDGVDEIDFSLIAAVTSLGDLTIGGNGTTQVTIDYIDDLGGANSIEVNSASAFTLDASDFQFV